MNFITNVKLTSDRLELYFVDFPVHFSQKFLHSINVSGINSFIINCKPRYSFLEFGFVSEVIITKKISVSNNLIIYRLSDLHETVVFAVLANPA